jgi:hypothetical protein
MFGGHRDFPWGTGDGEAAFPGFLQTPNILARHARPDGRGAVTVAEHLASQWIIRDNQRNFPSFSQ